MNKKVIGYFKITYHFFMVRKPLYILMSNAIVTTSLQYRYNTNGCKGD